MKSVKGAAVVASAGLAVCLLVAAACQDRRPGGRSADLLPGDEPRAKWEYKFRALDDPKMDSEKVFTELGRDGWEFVAVYQAPGPVNQFGTRPEFAVFKRPGPK